MNKIFQQRQRKAFTLAEVLITLAIIGIVAALTIPPVVQNYNKKQTVAKLKRANSILSQVLLQSVEDNGSVYALLSGKDIDNEITKQYIEKYWLPYFKYKKTYIDGQTPYDNVFAYSYLNGNTHNGSIMTAPNGRYIFITSDNTIYVIYYRKHEYDEKYIYTLTPYVYVDINGVKGPNTFGKDVFSFVIDYTNNTVKERCWDYTNENINRECSNSGVGFCCLAKIKRAGWKITDDYPW